MNKTLYLLYIFIGLEYIYVHISAQSTQDLDNDAVPNACGVEMNLAVDMTKRINSTGNIKQYKEGRLLQHKTFVCPVKYIPDTTNPPCNRNRICVMRPDSYMDLWQQCFAGVRIKWFSEGLLFSQLDLSCHSPGRDLLEDSMWCSDATRGSVVIEVYEYQERRRKSYSFMSAVTNECSNTKGDSFGLPLKVSYDEVDIEIDEYAGEPITYGLVTGIMLALFWLIVLLATYIYYKIQ